VASVVHRGRVLDNLSRRAASRLPVIRPSGFPPGIPSRLHRRPGPRGTVLTTVTSNDPVAGIGDGVRRVLPALPTAADWRQILRLTQQQANHRQIEMADNWTI